MFLDFVRFALAALWAHKLRATLTGLGMMIGNASVVIVATVALTGRGFVLRLIEGVGSNLIYAYYEPGERGTDILTPDDVEAVRLYRLSAAQNNPTAQNNLGVMYENGRGGLAADAAVARELYRKAAAQGSESGKSNLARLEKN